MIRATFEKFSPVIFNHPSIDTLTNSVTLELQKIDRITPDTDHKLDALADIIIYTLGAIEEFKNPFYSHLKQIVKKWAKERNIQTPTPRVYLKNILEEMYEYFGYHSKEVRSILDLYAIPHIVLEESQLNQILDNSFHNIHQMGYNPYLIFQEVMKDLNLRTGYINNEGKFVKTHQPYTPDFNKAKYNDHSSINIFLGYMGAGKTFTSYQVMESNKDLDLIQHRLPIAGWFKMVLKDLGITKNKNDYNSEDLYHNYDILSQGLKDYFNLSYISPNIKNVLMGFLIDIDKDDSPRWIMQHFASDILFQVGDKIHINKTLTEIETSSYGSFYVDDLRFPREVLTILKSTRPINFYIIKATDEVRAKRLGITLKELNDFSQHVSEQKVRESINLINSIPFGTKTTINNI